MKSLEAQFQDIIDARINTFDVEEVGKLVIEKTLRDTDRGVDPTSKPFTPYERKTIKKKGNATVNLRHYGQGIETLGQSGMDLSTTLAFSGTSGHGASAKSTGEVMFYHQKGTAKGGKQRKLFLEPEDMTSSGANELFQEITKVLAKHFNGN